MQNHASDVFSKYVKIWLNNPKLYIHYVIILNNNIWLKAKQTSAIIKLK